jgi:hypothetical protein
MSKNNGAHLQGVEFYTHLEDKSGGYRSQMKVKKSDMMEEPP